MYFMTIRSKSIHIWYLDDVEGLENVNELKASLKQWRVCEFTMTHGLVWQRWADVMPTYVSALHTQQILDVDRIVG